MALRQATRDEQTVRQVLEGTVEALEQDDSVSRALACEAVEVHADGWSGCRDRLIEDLLQAEDWLDRETALAQLPGAPVDQDDDLDFMPSHPTVALVQSAMEERLDLVSADAFDIRDVRWLSTLYHRLRARVRGKAPFPEHARLEDFRFELADRASVALVSDWGTGGRHAAAVARQIARRDPDHVIHLGDVYYSGTPREVHLHFLDMWRAHGPSRARYWALNANHDMYCGGYGYFGHLLPAIGQPASYFSLGNAAWRLIGLDTGYVNGSFTTPQMTWLEAQFAGRARPILLTHHHLLSAFRKRGSALEQWLEPHLAAGRFHGWFWGHEHHLVEYADHRGVRCRCIGHGALPYVPPDLLTRRHPVDIVRIETRRSPTDLARGMHGFALLTFDGPVLHIEYVDEEGGTAWAERWD
ncbi:Calcineurin-like phosphoesterase [Luteitalea pratensis]|uniref:Calcineurin-like phosphoesterase n=1 Tax=Luteitalea pratensis TaxID=1855912 RepID=A0A143PJM4_LUTPR|nr:metallophosphoesterase [Luteitalea pratensis]AMY08616.1 Calcineurin-like phosphoesterase [Luteitalea pratensis]